MRLLKLKFKKFIKNRQLIGRGQSVLLAISGGIDSMVMLHLFLKIQKEMNLKLSVVHINHQLRGGESNGDEDFVRNITSKFNLPFYCERVDVKSLMKSNKLSKQAAARHLRYECFKQIRQRINADLVATAHQANDNAETVLLNILRGTGLHGLAGIPLKRGTDSVIRPLLFARRSEINDYAKHFGIEYRNDSSNKSLVYSRNFLRNKIIPSLQKKVPFVIDNLNSIADIMSDVNKKLNLLVDEKLRMLTSYNSSGNLILEVKKFLSEPYFLQDEILLGLMNLMEIEPDSKKIDALRRLCSLSTGKKLELGGKHSAYKDRENVIFTVGGKRRLNVQHVGLGKSYNCNGCQLIISEREPIPVSFEKTPVIEYIDADLLSEHLVLRSWHEGDWFIPLGMKKKKKLSDFFADQKVPRYLKSSIPILESEGNIVWICGKRLDDRFKLTERSRAAIRLSYQPTI